MKGAEKTTMESLRKESVLPKEEVKSKLWNLNFILLWQGQLVSSFGDSVYDIALGFWILAKTGSTAVMGILMAMSVLPRVLLSPFAGVLADRLDKKWLMVITDGIRGITITSIGFAAILGNAEVWMVMVGGVILGICGSLFNPAVQSALPIIISKEHLVKGNSAISLASTGVDIVGKSMGGFLFQVLGAPILFLVNGISYIVSAISELFIRIPRVTSESRSVNFVDDIKSGFQYVSKNSGLKYLYLTIACLNFFAVMALILLLPYFNSKSYLGPEKYGIAMAVSATGMFMGFFVLTIIDINKYRKSLIFSMGGMISGVSIGLLPFTKNFTIILTLMLVNGVCVAIVRTLLQSSIQSSVPQNMLGKIFGFRRALSSSLVPLSMALGGIAAEFIPMKTIISLGNAVIFLLFLKLGFTRAVITIIDGKKE